MKILKILLLIFIFIFLQGYLIDYITIKTTTIIAKPNFPLIALVYLSLEFGYLFGTLFGFFIGLSIDTFTPLFLGLSAFCKSWIGFTVGIQQGNLFKDNPLTQSALMLGAFLFHDLIYLILYTKLEMNLFSHIFINQSLPSAIYTALIAPPLIFFAKKILIAKEYE